MKIELISILIATTLTVGCGNPEIELKGGTPTAAETPPANDLPASNDVPPATKTRIAGKWAGEVTDNKSKKCNIKADISEDESSLTVRQFEADCNGLSMDELKLDLKKNENPAVLAYDVYYSGKKSGWYNTNGSSLFVEITKDGVKLVLQFATVGENLTIKGTMLKTMSNTVIFGFEEGSLKKQ